MLKKFELYIGVELVDVLKKFCSDFQKNVEKMYEACRNFAIGVRK